jgi:hypothetical protein
MLVLFGVRINLKITSCFVQPTLLEIRFPEASGQLWELQTGIGSALFFGAQAVQMGGFLTRILNSIVHNP